MSQEDTKKALQVRGNINAERLRAVMEKAKESGYELQFSISVDTGAAAPDEAAPAPGDDDQGPR